jgi:hypothetical protein
MGSKVEPMPHRDRPCQECPWRRDTPPGQFGAERYKALRCTTGSRGHEAHLGSPLFACHKSTEDASLPGAGWLAAVGIESIPVRLLVIHGRLPQSVLSPGADWPELFGSYEEMERHQARKMKRGRKARSRRPRERETKAP